MTEPNTTPTEETWWEVLTTTGLMLALPAPLSLIDNTPLDPLEVLDAAKRGQGRIRQSVNTSNGRRYVLDLMDVVLIKPYTVATNPDRYQRSVAKALGLSLDGASNSGPAASSPSDARENPSGPSTGAPIRRNTLH